MPENKTDEEIDNKISRRDFLKIAGLVGASGSLSVLITYLGTEEGKNFISNLEDGNFSKFSRIEIDRESKKIARRFNETIDRSLEKLSSIEKEAAEEMKKRRDIVFAAAEKDSFDLKIGLSGEGEGRAITNVYYNPTDERVRVEITLPNVPTTTAEMIKHFSHELGHAYQFTALLSEFGFKSKEVDEFMTGHNNEEYEMDAWIFDNLAAYLYTQTHPNDKDYGLILSPEELGIDQLGFVGFWIDRKEELPQKLTDDLEYRWFLERYGALSDVGLDILSGEDHGPPLFALTVRDTEVGEEFINEARKYFVPSGWSEGIGMEMDPTENNRFILRHFVLDEK